MLNKLSLRADGGETKAGVSNFNNYDAATPPPGKTMAKC
jgi:hypothetical protein